MADDVAQYELKSVRTMRGLEARTRAKWQKDGWEFVDQSQRSLLQTEMTFRRLKTKRPWYVWGALVGALLLIGVITTVGAVTQGKDGGGTPKATTAAVSTPETTPTATPTATQQASPEAVATRPLDQTMAAQFLARQWEAKFLYGGTVHWIEDRITTQHPDGTFTFKIGATFKNQYGTDVKATIEGDVGGTDDAPTVIDSILYTDAGDTINFNG